MNSTEPAKPIELTLSEADRNLLERLRTEERSPLHAFWLFASAAFLIWYGWDAPFALGRFDEMPSDIRQNLPYAAIHSLGAWSMGVFWLFRGIHSTFFDRKRRLLVKLAARLVPEVIEGA